MMEIKGIERAMELDKKWLISEQPTIHPDDIHGLSHAAESTPLFDDNVAEQFRTHWLEIQNLFVDNPNASVKDADKLVTSLTEHIISAFSDERLILESQWDNGDRVSTEDLRLVLKRYRSFFNRLLALKY